MFSKVTTVGLSDSPIYSDSVELNLRVEFVGACASSVTDFANIVSTAATCVMKSKWWCFPSWVYPGVVDMYDCSTTMRYYIKRHADGGRTTDDNLAILCDPCHKDIHRK